MTTIFDIGCNNGDDIPYYLLKAERVVAFEANPILCRALERRFPDEIRSGRVIIEGGVLCADKDAKDSEMPFYIHKEDDVLGQFPEPPAHLAGLFDKIEIPVRTLSDAVEKYGTPYYAKIDIEHYDHVILSEFRRLEVFPTYISAECHSLRVLSELFAFQIYKGFKLVVGIKVHEEYARAEVVTSAGRKAHFSFPLHSAGPFGEDVSGPWYDRKSLSKRLALERFGWKDVHASSIDAGSAIDVPLPIRRRRRYIKNEIKLRASEFRRRCLKVVGG